MTRRTLGPLLAPGLLLACGATAALALPPEPASAPGGVHAAAPSATAGSGGASQPGLTPLGNSRSPMDITADGVEVINPQHLTIFKGNVEVINDTTRLRTPELRVWNKPKAASAPGQAAATANTGGPIGSDTGSIDHIEAAGPVYYITPTQNARGDSMLYEATPDIITLTGHVVLVQGKSVARGDKFIMYRKTGQNQLISNSPQAPADRVRVILYPQDQQPAGARTASAAPGKPSR